jgi:membrane-associated phospholipid phosphatase
LVAPLACFFALASWALSGRSGPTGADTVLAPGLPRHYGGLQHTLEAVTKLGGPVGVAAASVCLALLCLALRHRLAALLCLVGPALAGAMAEWFLKPLIDRRMDGDLAFPSGQATGAVAVAVVIALLLLPGGALREGLGRAAQGVLWVATAAFGAGVGVALVVLHLHYATDVLGATVLAPVVIVTLAAVLDRLGGRGGVRRPGATDRPALA